MKSKLANLIVVPNLLLILGACGSGVKDSVDKVASNLKNPELIHTWERDKCDSSSIFGASFKVQYQFAGNEVKRTEQYFSSADCVDLAGTITYSGNYDRKDEVQKGVYAIDTTFSAVKVTAVNESGKKLLDAASFCGKTDWVVNVPVDLTAHNRDKLCPVKALPEPIFDIYTVEGNKLYFGKSDNKTTVANRPVEIDRAVPFHQL